jgi:hypothetical protein
MFSNILQILYIYCRSITNAAEPVKNYLLPSHGLQVRNSGYTEFVSAFNQDPETSLG